MHSIFLDEMILMHNDILDVAKKVALEAGKIMMRDYGRDYSFTYKIDSSIQTEVDLKLDNYIRETLLEKYPEYSVMSEELPKLGQKSEYMWLIDPIDGTSNYKHEISFFYIDCIGDSKFKVINHLFR